MESCAETLMRGFSDRLSVLVPSPYAYQNAFPLLRAEWHQRDLRFVIANAKSGAVKLDTAALRRDLKAGGRLAVLIDRIIAGHSVDWDGSNMVGRLDDDAKEASEALEDALHGPARWSDSYLIAA
jgi:hypothetical protein